MTDLHDLARGYAERSWHVFPLRSRDKEPLLPRCPDAVDDDGRKVYGDRLTTHLETCRRHGHGLHDATVDLDIIDAWWTATPDANIGIATGPSNLAVVDVDDELGLTNLERDHGELPDTLMAVTGGGGLHYIYEGDVKSTTSKLEVGIDTRGRGGYIVAPGSIHPSGEPYAWLTFRRPEPVPDWIVDLADQPKLEMPPQPPVDMSANTTWGQRVLDGEIARVAAAAEGTRNAELFAAACKVYEAVKGGHIDEQAATRQLEHIGQLVGLEPHEIAASLDSAWGRTDPRHPEPRPELPDLTAPRLTEAPALPDVAVPADQTDTAPAFDVLTPAQLAAIPPPEWLLPHRIPEGLTFIDGHPKTGKSFVALDWTATIAAKRGARVLYFIGEGVSGFAQRAQSWQAAHPGADLSTFGVIPLAPQLLDPVQAQMVYATVRQHRADLIVVDTFSRATRGADENSHVDMSRAIGVIDECRIAYSCSAIVVHHLNASGQKARGHTAIGGAVDAEWRVEADAEIAGGLTVTNTMMKDAGTSLPIIGRLAPVGQSVVLDPSAYERWGQL